jgi:hypothetical protein
LPSWFFFRRFPLFLVSFKEAKLLAGEATGAGIAQYRKLRSTHILTPLRLQPQSTRDENILKNYKSLTKKHTHDHTIHK